MTHAGFTLPSFAKINLSLRVLGRRSDGYHELRTIFQTITLFDELTFEPRADGRFELFCDDSHIPTDETNLIARAAKLLRQKSLESRVWSLGSKEGRQETGDRRQEKNPEFRSQNPELNPQSAICNPQSSDSRLQTPDPRLSLFGARVTLKKRIPAGGGLGGGSSNAAVALIGLARLWRIKTNPEELAKLGAKLGADVPFFFTGGTALGAGRGATIFPLEDAPPKELIVITPPVHISTAEAYQSLNAPALTNETAQTILTVSGADAVADLLQQESARNDFEAIIFRLYPEIAKARDALIAHGAESAMLSGSGASVFGIFDNQVLRDEVCAALERENEGKNLRWRIFPCATLIRKDYMRAIGESFLPMRVA